MPHEIFLQPNVNNASYAVSASYAQTASIAANAGTITSASYAETASYAANAPTIDTSSFVTNSETASFAQATVWQTINASMVNTTGTDSNPAFALVPGSYYIIDYLSQGAFNLAVPDPANGGDDIHLRDENSSNTSGWILVNDAGGTGVGSLWYGGVVTDLSYQNTVIAPNLLNGELLLVSDTTDVQWIANEEVTNEALIGLVKNLTSGGTTGNITFPSNGTLLTTTGNGSGLTSLNGANISSGVIGVGRLGNVATTFTVNSANSTFSVGSAFDQTLLVQSPSSPTAMTSLSVAFPLATSAVKLTIATCCAVTSFTASYTGGTALDAQSMAMPTSLAANTIYIFLENHAGNWNRIQ